MDKKKIILCDTNILFGFFHQNENIVAEFQILGFERLALSSITVAETYFGMKKRETRQTKEIINKFGIFHLDKNVSQRFLKIMFDYRNQIQIPDALIAATALVNDLELYTLNIKDFDFIDRIKIYKPKF